MLLPVRQQVWVQISTSCGTAGELLCQVQKSVLVSRCDHGTTWQVDFLVSPDQSSLVWCRQVSLRVGAPLLESGCCHDITNKGSAEQRLQAMNRLCQVFTLSQFDSRDRNVTAVLWWAGALRIFQLICFYIFFTKSVGLLAQPVAVIIMYL